jgi:hypothetical protein
MDITSNTFYKCTATFRMHCIMVIKYAWSYDDGGVSWGASVQREETKTHDLSQWHRVVCLTTKLNLSCVSLHSISFETEENRALPIPTNRHCNILWITIHENISTFMDHK